MHNLTSFGGITKILPPKTKKAGKYTVKIRLLLFMKDLAFAFFKKACRDWVKKETEHKHWMCFSMALAV